MDLEKNLKKMSDHDLLIHISTVVDILQKGQDNHLAHHRSRDLAMLAVTLGAIFTSIISITGTILAFSIKLN